MARSGSAAKFQFSLKPLAGALALALGVASINAGAIATPPTSGNALMQNIRELADKFKADPSLLPHLRKHHRANAARVRHSPPIMQHIVTAGTCVDNPSSATTPGTLRYMVINAQEGDTIDLSGLTCSTITLTQGALPVTVNTLTVQGPTADTLTIDANHLDRAFVHTGDNSVTFNHLIIDNGQVSYQPQPPPGATAENALGAAGGCVFSYGAVYLNNTTVTGCTVSATGGTTTNGVAAIGGGVFAYGLYLQNSIISNNSATADIGYAAGGGAAAYFYYQQAAARKALAPKARAQVYGGYASVINSTISGNTASAGSEAIGGGLAAYVVNTYAARISNNTANQLGTGDGNTTYFAFGGGISSKYGAVISHSTISGNGVNCAITMSPCFGGGVSVASFNGSIGKYSNFQNSTINNNTAPVGGGLFGGYGFSLVQSTVTNNNALAGGGLALFGSSNANATAGRDGKGGPKVKLESSYGYGKYFYNSTVSGNSALYGGGGVALNGSGTQLTLSSTIVAKNSAPAGADINAYSGIGINGANNFVNDVNNVTVPVDTLTGDPLLQPLADNGGLTSTMALTVGSPALNKGNNDLGFAFDQRDTGFPRVIDGVADIGAFEGSVAALAPRQPAPTLSIWALALLAAAMSWIGWRRSRAANH